MFTDLWGYFQKFQKQYPGTYRTCIGPYPVVVTDNYVIVDKVLQSKEMLDKPSFYRAINLPYGLIGSECKFIQKKIRNYVAYL
jgi:hypothetical protein